MTPGQQLYHWYQQERPIRQMDYYRCCRLWYRSIEKQLDLPEGQALFVTFKGYQLRATKCIVKKDCAKEPEVGITVQVQEPILTRFDQDEIRNLRPALYLETHLLRWYQNEFALQIWEPK